MFKNESSRKKKKNNKKVGILAKGLQVWKPPSKGLSLVARPAPRNRKSLWTFNVKVANAAGSESSDFGNIHT